MKNQSKTSNKPVKIKKTNHSDAKHKKANSHTNSHSHEKSHEKKEQPHSYNPYNSWANIFNSAFSDDVKSYMNNCMKGTNTSFCGMGTASNHSTNINKDMVTKLSQNIRHNFEQNMNLGSEILKCKTATDFVEFGRKSFEVNYKNTMKLYSDVMHDMQNMMNQSLKDVKNYTNKSAKDLVHHSDAHS